MLEKKTIKTNILLLFIGQCCFILGLLDYFVPYNPNFRFLSILALVGSVITLIAAVRFKNTNKPMKNVLTASIVLIVFALSRFIIGTILEAIGNSMFIVINFVLAIVGLVACAFLTHEVIAGVKVCVADPKNEKLELVIWKLFCIYVIASIVTSAIGFIIWCINGKYLFTQISNIVIFIVGFGSEGLLSFYLYRCYKFIE